MLPEGYEAKKTAAKTTSWNNMSLSVNLKNNDLIPIQCHFLLLIRYSMTFQKNLALVSSYWWILTLSTRSKTDHLMWRSFLKHIYDILKTWKHMTQNMKVLVLACHFGGAGSDNIWNKCWIVSVWLTSELLTNQRLRTILLLSSEPESIRMSVSEGGFHAYCHFLCLIYSGRMKVN